MIKISLKITYLNFHLNILLPGANDLSANNKDVITAWHGRPSERWQAAFLTKVQ